MEPCTDSPATAVNVLDDYMAVAPMYFHRTDRKLKAIIPIKSNLAAR